MSETVLQHPTDDTKKVELEYPFNPGEAPSDNQLFHRAISGKVYVGTISGDSALSIATITRTYRLNQTQKDALNTFLKDDMDEWTGKFKLKDPIIGGTIENVYVERKKFRGYQPFQNGFYLATLHFAVSPS